MAENLARVEANNWRQPIIEQMSADRPEQAGDIRAFGALLDGFDRPLPADIPDFAEFLN
jgi:hypothetical protein